MARRKAGNGQGYSGKVGGVVYVQSNGQEIMRTVQVRNKKSWSPRQRMHRERFKKISEYCRRNSHVIKMIWNLAAEYGNGHNLFLKSNAPAFALDGELSMIEKLHFSAGKIPLPQQITAKRSESDPAKVEAAWKEDENLPEYYTDDELMMVCTYPGLFTKPINTGVLRKSGSALIDLPEGAEKITGIWLFFSAHKKDAYSVDQFFKI